MVDTIFNTPNVFRTLSTVPFAEISPLARALQSSLIEPAGFSIINQIDEQTRPGFSADTPGTQSRPLQLALDNFLILSNLTTQFEERLIETRQSFIQVQETLDNAIRNRNPNIQNGAASILESSLLAQLFATAEELGLLETSAEVATSVPKFQDFTLRPNETRAFGNVLDSAVRNAALSSSFVSGVALAAGNEITLDQLLVNNQGSGEGFLVSIQNELGGDSQAQLLTAGGASISNGTFVASTDFASTRLQAGSGGLGALDFLSIAEANEDGSGGYDERGLYQTVAVTSNAAVGIRAEGANAEEPIREFSFYTESGVAYPQIQLQFSGLDTSTYADALTAVQNNAIRVQIGETLIDGSLNQGQVDRLNSSANELRVVFPFKFIEEGLAQNGIDVEVRSIDGSYDISNIRVSATFP